MTTSRTDGASQTFLHCPALRFRSVACASVSSSERTTAHAFREACEWIGVKQSMGGVGSALDDAVIESWHSTLQFERRSLEAVLDRASARINPRSGLRRPIGGRTLARSVLDHAVGRVRDRA